MEFLSCVWSCLNKKKLHLTIMWPYNIFFPAVTEESMKVVNSKFVMYDCPPNTWVKI